MVKPILSVTIGIAALMVASATANAEGISQSLPEPADLDAGKRYKRVYPELDNWRGEPMRYYVTLPERYDPERRYPIIFEWPGKGGTAGTAVFLDTYNVRGHIHVGLGYPEQSDNGGALLYPTESYVAFMRHVYDDVVSSFRGDGDHVFIGGFSAGGFMTTGPGIAMMMRAELRDALAGVLAGGCNWMCNPKYAHELPLLLWYAEDDPNSRLLPDRIPKLRKYASELKVVRRDGGAHACKNEIEGAAIRRFLARHGPEKEVFKTLYQYRDAVRQSNGSLDQLRECRKIAQRDTGAGAFAQRVLNQAANRIDKQCKRIRTQRSKVAARRRMKAMLGNYEGLADIRQLVRDHLTQIKDN